MPAGAGAQDLAMRLYTPQRTPPAWKAGARVVVDDLGVRLIEAGSQVRLGGGQADGIANALAQWPCTPRAGRQRLCTADRDAGTASKTPGQTALFQWLGPRLW